MALQCNAILGFIFRTQYRFSYNYHMGMQVGNWREMNIKTNMI